MNFEGIINSYEATTARLPLKFGARERIPFAAIFRHTFSFYHLGLCALPFLSRLEERNDPNQRRV